MTELKGHEELTGFNRPDGVEHGMHASRKNWKDRRIIAENVEGDEEPTVFIIGNTHFQ